MKNVNEGQHATNIESVTSNERFDFMAFTRRTKSVFITAVFYIGASGAIFTSAPKRTGKIIITKCFS